MNAHINYLMLVDAVIFIYIVITSMFLWCGETLLAFMQSRVITYYYIVCRYCTYVLPYVLHTVLCITLDIGSTTIIL